MSAIEILSCPACHCPSVTWLLELSSRCARSAYMGALQKRIGDYSITFYVLEKTHIPAARFILTYDFTDFLTTILRGVIIVNIIDDYPD